MTHNNIHREIGFADCHFDLGCALYNFRKNGEDDPLRDRFLPEWKENGLKILVAAIFIEDSYIPEQALRVALEEIEIIYEEAAKSPDDVMVVTSRNEFEECLAKDRIAIVISLEGLEPVGNSITLLGLFERLGMSGCGLVWSRANDVASGSSFAGEETRNGLSAFGEKVTQSLHDAGRFIDVSHLNEAGTNEVLDRFESGVIASHSNCRSICDISRNLSDEQIRKIGEKNGIIGVNGCRPIIASDGSGGIAALCDHIERIVDLAGIEHVAVGLDRCDLMDMGLTAVKEFGSAKLDVIETYDDLSSVSEELITRGFTEDMLYRFYIGNVKDFLMRNLPVTE